jgi:hypothetical protein
MRIVGGAVALRLASAVLALLVNVSIPPAQPPQTTMFAAASPFWDPFTRYDSGWYFQIAHHGYGFVEGGPSVGVGKAGKIAFFPLYPLLMRYAGRLFGSTAGDVYLGGIAVSWTAFVLAMLLLYAVASLDIPPERAERAVLLTAIFPFSFFFGMVYTESLFLLLTLATFYAFRKGWWIAGGVAGALTTATRVNGILMLPALAWIAWKHVGPSPRERASAVLGLLLVATGVAAYSVFVYQLSGHPFEWAASIRRWGYQPGGAPWMAPVHLVQKLATHPYVYLSTDPVAPYDVLYGMAGVLFALAIPMVWLRLGAAYGLFMALNLWLPLSSGVFEGVGRYCAILFPCFIWLATIEWAAVSTALVVGFALVYTLALALFTTVRPLF